MLARVAPSVPAAPRCVARRLAAYVVLARHRSVAVACAATPDHRRRVRRLARHGGRRGLGRAAPTAAGRWRTRLSHLRCQLLSLRAAVRIIATAALALQGCGAISRYAANARAAVAIRLAMLRARTHRAPVVPMTHPQLLGSAGSRDRPLWRACACGSSVSAAA